MAAQDKRQLNFEHEDNMNKTSVEKLRTLQSRMKTIGVTRVFDSHSHAFDKHDVRFRPRKPTMAALSFSHYPMARNLKVARIVFSEFKHGYRQVVFGLPAHNVDLIAQNARTLHWAKNDSRIVPLALVTPKMNRAEIETLVRQGFKGLKPYPEFYPRFRKKVNINLYLTEDMLAVCENERIPVILHAIPDASTSPSTQKIIEMAEKHPRVNIILAHMGRGRNAQNARILCNAIKKHPNIFVSTSVTSDQEVFEIALKALGPKRVLFGTDFPWGLIQASLKKIGKRYGSKEVPKQLRGWQYLPKKKYKWTTQEVYELSSEKHRKGFDRLIVSELDALIGVLERMLSKGEISKQGIQAVFNGNAAHLFKQRG